MLASLFLQGFGLGAFLEIVGADEEDDALRVEGEHVVLEAKEDAARGVAADAAVR